MVKNLPAMQETWVQSMGREDDPGEGNGNPLQYSCLENSMDRPRGRKESDTTESLTLSFFTATKQQEKNQHSTHTPMFHQTRDLVFHPSPQQEEVD